MGRDFRKPFALLRPIRSQKPHVPKSWVLDREPTVPEVLSLAHSLRAASAVAIDFETRGVRTWAKEDGVVGLGVAWRDGDGRDEARYFDWACVSPARRRLLWWALRQVRSGVPVVAHNLYFDVGHAWVQAVRDGVHSGETPPRPTESWPVAWTHCTYGLYRQLASEGWVGQEWGLKAAMADCLGWGDTNERERDEWLLSRGYHKVGPKRAQGPNARPDLHRLALKAWVAESPSTRTGKVRPKLGEMHRVPAPILGAYCCFDALATLKLFLDVLLPCLTGVGVDFSFRELQEFHEGPWLHVALLLAEQTRVGVRVDRPLFEARVEWLLAETAAALAECRAAPGLKAEVEAIERRRLEEVLRELHEKEPPKFNAGAVPEEPAKRTKKDGSPTAGWLKWRERMDVVERDGPPVATRWLAWEARVADAPNRVKPWSPGSPDQLRAALFESGLVRVWSDEVDPDSFVVDGVNGHVPIPKTDAGLFSTDAKLLSQLPDALRLPLERFADADTELAIARSYLKHFYFHEAEDGPDSYGEPRSFLKSESVDLDADNVEAFGGDEVDDVADAGLDAKRRGTWRLHPGWKVPGTKTGRLGGKDPNLQAAPKALAFLDPFVPDEGCVWVEADWAALEPHVLAELSRDEGLLALYGPDANPNHDRYLYTVARLPSDRFDEVRRHYDVEAPTAEGVAAAKKACKKERALAKVLVLAGDYGAGPRKKWMACLLQGVRLSLDEVKALHYDQLDAAAGVQRFKQDLESEWVRRGGWVLSGLGHPVTVHEDFTRDLVNRVVQRTGHDVHTLCVWVLESLLAAAGVRAVGVVWDFHDQYIFQVKKRDLAKALKLCTRATEELNSLLGGVVKLKMEPRAVRSLSEAKVGEDYEARQAERDAAK